jgi:hypothetical protein
MSETKKPTLADLIDELGSIDEQLGPLEPKRKRATELRKTISASIPLQPEESTVVNGVKFCATVGPKKNETKIQSIARVFKILKKETFLEICSVTLEKLKTAVGEVQFSTLVITSRTGARTIDTFRRPEDPPRVA